MVTVGDVAAIVAAGTGVVILAQRLVRDVQVEARQEERQAATLSKQDATLVELARMHSDHVERFVTHQKNDDIEFGKIHTSIAQLSKDVNGRVEQLVEAKTEAAKLEIVKEVALRGKPTRWDDVKKDDS